MSNSMVLGPVRWAYGVTTVPARVDDWERNLDYEPTLTTTLRSLAAGGFDTPRLFLDGHWDPRGLADTFHLPVTCRHPAARPYGSWLLALLELYLRDATADRYAIFQDDLLVPRNLRQYLEQCVYPGDPAPGPTALAGPPVPAQPRGYWNLHTLPRNEHLCPQGPDGACLAGWYASDQMGKGALGLVFSRQCVQALLASPTMYTRAEDQTFGWRSIDGAVVTAMVLAGWREYVHMPSLTYHTGQHSTIGGIQPPAATFPGIDYDCVGERHLLDITANGVPGGAWRGPAVGDDYLAHLAEAPEGSVSRSSPPGTCPYRGTRPHGSPRV